MLFLLLGIAFTATGGSSGSIMEPVRVEVVAQEGSVAVLPCADPAAKSRTWTRTLHHAHSFQWVRRSGDQSSERTVCRREKSGLMYRSAGSSLSERIYCTPDHGLRVSSVREADAGEYVCSLAQGGMTIVALRVIRVSFSSPEVIEGGSLTVTCHITPAPRWTKVSWKLNGEECTTCSRGRDVKVAKVSQSHQGNWTCIVESSVRTRSHTAEATKFLNVKGIERPPVNGALVYASVGSSATLPCIFSQGLSPNATWTKLSKEGLSSSTSSFSTGPSVSSLPHLFVPHTAVSWDGSWRLERVEMGHEGSYRCSGQVEGRRVERDVELVTVQVVHSTSRKKSGLTLTCQLSNDKEVTRYVWLRVTYDNTSIATVTTIGQGGTLKLPIVTADDIGEWVCRYYGKSGLLGNVTYHLQLMGGLEAGETEGQQKSSGRVLIIGLSLLLLLVLLIGLQMYRNHRRRKMILPYPALENIIHSLANQREEKERQKMNKKKSGPVEEEV